MNSDKISMPRRSFIGSIGTAVAATAVGGSTIVQAAAKPSKSEESDPPIWGTPGFTYAKPRFRHTDEEKWREMRIQNHGGKRVSVHEKWLEYSPRVLAFIGKWDPGMIVQYHGHMSINSIFILEGSMMCGDVLCTKGMQITLDIGTPYGPNIAGPEGVTTYQVMLGDPTPWYADPDGFKALMREKGVTQLPNPPLNLPPGAKG